MHPLRPTPTTTGSATTARTPTTTGFGQRSSFVPAQTRQRPTPTATGSATAAKVRTRTVSPTRTSRSSAPIRRLPIRWRRLVRWRRMAGRDQCLERLEPPDPPHATAATRHRANTVPASINATRKQCQPGAQCLDREPARWQHAAFPSGSCYRLGGDQGLIITGRNGLTLIGTGAAPAPDERGQRLLDRPLPARTATTSPSAASASTAEHGHRHDRAGPASTRASRRHGQGGLRLRRVRPCHLEPPVRLRHPAHRAEARRP